MLVLLDVTPWYQQHQQQHQRLSRSRISSNNRAIRFEQADRCLPVHLQDVLWVT